MQFSNTAQQIFTDTRRPASHQWAIALFILTLVGSLMQFLRAIGYGKPPVVVAGPHAPTLLLCIVALIALVGLFGGARRRWGYYLTSACLGAKCMYNFVVSCYYVFLHMHPNGAVVIPSQRNNWIATVVYLALLVFLFYRYTFGAPSRRYYGLGKAMEPPPLP